MDSIHEAHLSRILEGRRRRGVLGEYTVPVAAPPPQQAPYSDPSPPPPRRVSTTAATQTAEERKTSAAAQTRTEWGSAAAAVQPFSTAASAPSPSQLDWRQSVPRNVGGTGAAPQLAQLNPSSSLDGAVRFQSPGRVPSLAYSTPASSPPRRSSPWQPHGSAPSPALTPPLAESTRRSIEPLPPPLYIPRARSTSREPLRQPSSFTPYTSRWAASPGVESNGGFHSGFNWQPSSSPVRPVLEDNMPFTSTWRNRAAMDNARSFRSGFHFSPLSIHREENYAAPLTPWPTTLRPSTSPHRRSSRCHLHHRRNHHHRQSCDDDDDGSEEDVQVDLPLPRHHSRGGGRSRAGSRRRSPSSAHPRGSSARRGRGYAPPVVYMGNAEEMRAMSPSSAEGTPRHRQSQSSGSQRRSRNPPIPRPFQDQRKYALGLPDARSTMDLRTSIETLRAGDWFYKWSAKGDVVRRRWVWVDTKSYLLVWSNRETRNAHFCGDVRLDHICQVTSRDLTSVDEDGFPKTYYVLLIETTKRVLQLATELKDKCDAWFEALNNVMGFIHRNDIAKGALVPD